MTVLEFQASKHRKVLEDFLQSETGVHVLTLLNRLRPSPDPSTAGIEGTLTEKLACQCAQIKGYEWAQQVLITLKQLPQQRQASPTPSYSSPNIEQPQVQPVAPRRRKS